MLYTIGNDSDVLLSNQDALNLINKLKGQKFKLLADNIDGNIQSIDEYPDSNPSRKFIVLQFENDRLQDIQQFLKTDLDNPKHLIYRMNKNGRMRLVIALKNALGKKGYHQILKSLAQQMQIEVSQTLLQITKPVVFAKFEEEDIVENTGKDPLEIDNEAIASPDHLLLNQKRLINATDDFFKKIDVKNVFKNRQKATSFFDSLASSYLDKMLNMSYIDQVINYIAKQTDYEAKNWHKLFDDRIKLLKDNPDLKENTKPFGDYIHLYTQADNANNIAQQLRTMLPADAQPDPDYELAEACRFIEMAYPPYLLDQTGSDLDNLVIFDAISGYWTHDKDTMYSLLTAIRPYSTKQQLETYLMTFAAKARNANRFIKAYSGSRYLLFNNCMLDVETMKTYNLSDNFVRDLHFTERSKIDIDYVEDPPLPQIQTQDYHRMADEGPWNPRDFLMAYANNEHNRYVYLLFGLSLGLFGGHNFVTHFDIQGESRWGKTTLSEIFKALYPSRVVVLPFASLNDPFPFTSYPLNTSVIWINENNVGADPLNESNGTTIYDGLGDDSVRFRVKRKGDLVIQNPPQVYVDGTQFIKAKELYTGPAGRTLAFKLPPMTEELRNQSYGTGINHMLHDERVLQWIVYNCIMAYKEIVPEDRMGDLKINLANKHDLALFPSIALDWRKEFVVGGSTIDDWFENNIAPYLSTDPKAPTYLHPRVLYELYLADYQWRNPNDRFGHNAKTSDDVIKRLKTIWDSESDKYTVQYDIGNVEKGRAKARKMISSPAKMNFNWKAFDTDFARPDNLQSPGYNNLKLFGKRSTGWISIVKRKQKNVQTTK